MTSSNLVPTPITDKNGKATTVYKSVDAPQTPQKSGLPAPVMTAYIPPKKALPVASESYADRKQRIRQEAVAEPDRAAKAQRAVQAFTCMQNIMLSAASNTDSSEREDFALRIGMLGEVQDFEAILLADRFAAVHYTLADSIDNDDEWDEPLELEFNGDDTSDWESEYLGINDHVQIIDLVMTLRENHFMSPTEVPEHGEPRFLAHLYLSATQKLNYRHDDDETIAMMNIVDEFPEQTNLIAEGLDKGLWSAGIKALLAGTVTKGVASGVL
jgi:hypothetical protein